MAKPRKNLEPVSVGGTGYESVLGGATDQALGAAGLSGDHLARLVVTVTTSATAAVDIQDGAGTAINIVPANTPIGVYTIELGIDSASGGWSVTTGAGVTVLAVGDFS
jgi:hypothetical protein